MIIDLLFNALLIAADAAIVRFRGKRPAVTVVLGGLGAAVLGVLMGGEFFGILRLWAYAIFLHGPIVLAALAWAGRTSKPAAWTYATLAALTAAVAVDAFLIEPGRLEVSRVRIASPKLRKSILIGVLSDLQTDKIGEHEARAVRRLMAEKPDLILLPGDFIQAGPERAAVTAAARELFRKEGLAAPLGVYAVQGNVDPPGWTDLFRDLPVTCFDRTGSMEKGGLRVTGLSFQDGFDSGIRIASEEIFHVVFAHGPDFALGDVKADLLVAGHTHGGQVRLPFVGPLMTLSRIPRAWAAGATRLEGGRTLVVTRGVGMERGRAPRLRFLCPPELTMIELVPSPGGP